MAVESLESSRRACATRAAHLAAWAPLAFLALACTSGSGREPARAISEEPARADADPDQAAGRGEPAAPAIAQASATEPASSPALLVELFTSQGCSSCPPADELLRRLGTGEALAHGRGGQDAASFTVIPLAFHVDYWNYLGWSDPFSSARWTSRQNLYAQKIAGGRLYTPQLVIHGRTHAVGSQRREIVATLDEIASHLAPPAHIAITASRDGKRFAVSASAGRAAQVGSAPASDSALQAWVALFENNVVTRVPRGENAGRALHNDHIVRALEPVFTIPSGRDAGGGSVSIDLLPAWHVENLGVAVFLQDLDTLAIAGARALSPGMLHDPATAL